MKKLKKLLAVVMMIALMIPVTAFAAEGGSATKVDISKAKTTVSVSKVAYNGKKAAPKTITVKVNGVTLKKGTDYKVAITNSKNAGTYAKGVKITGIGKYTGTVYGKLTINTAVNPVKVATGKTFKASALKKKAGTCTISVKDAQGKVTYKSGSKYLKVTTKGKVTVKKGTKKGTYKITVKVAGNKNYKAKNKVFKVVVK